MTLDITQLEVPLKTLVISRDYACTDEKFVDRLARQILRRCWNNPILVDDRLELVAGIRRVWAAHKAGKPVVTAIMVHGASDVMLQELVKQDQRMEASGEWTIPLVRQVLDAFAFDVDCTAPGGIGVGEILGVSKLWKEGA